MDKLQWFKFTPSDWMMGKIQRCPEVTQARFLRLCCLYWNKECKLSIEDAIIEIDKEHFETLKNKKIISVNSTHFSISFLDEQYLEIDEKAKNRSESGIIGNLKRWHPDIYSKFELKKISLKEAIELSKSIATQSLPDSTPIAKQSQNIADKSREDKDNNNMSTLVDISFDFDAYIKAINDAFGKNHRVVTPKLRRQMTALLKTGLTKEDIMTAIENCKNSEFHKKENYRHCTPEFFSRIDKVDYWSDVTETKKQKIQL